MSLFLIFLIIDFYFLYGPKLYKKCRTIISIIFLKEYTIYLKPIYINFCSFFMNLILNEYLEHSINLITKCCLKQLVFDSKENKNYFSQKYD